MSVLKTATPYEAGQSIALLGGTFDPIHRAHLYIALQAKQKLRADVCALMPCGQAFHKKDQKVTEKKQRLTMIQTALKQHPELTLETCEIDEDKPSITLETLKKLRNKYPKNALIYLMGEDVFASIESWDDWAKLINHSHIVIINRHHKTHQVAIPPVWQSALTQDIDDLHQHQSGCVFQLSIPPYVLSASQIRTGLKANEPKWLAEVPLDVKDYILKHHLYKT